MYIYICKYNILYTVCMNAAPRQGSQDQSFARVCSCHCHVVLDVPKPCVSQKSCTSTYKQKSLASFYNAFSVLNANRKLKTSYCFELNRWFCSGS